MPIVNVLVTGDKKAAMAQVLVDTGASVSFIHRALAEQLATIVPLATSQDFTLANGGILSVKESVSLTLELAGLTLHDIFLVLDVGVEDVVLGEATMRKHGLKLDFEHGSIFASIAPVVKVEKPLRKERSMEDILKRLFARLGMPASDDLTDDDAINMICERVSNNMYSLVASEPVLTLLGLPKEAKEPDVKGAILALQHPGNAVPIEQHQDIVNKFEALEHEHFLAIARAEGKVTPAEMTEGQPLATLYKNDFPTFKAFVDKRGKQIPLGEKRPDPGPGMGTAARAVGSEIKPLDINAIYMNRQKAREARR